MVMQLLGGVIVYWMANLRPGAEFFFIYLSVLSYENLVALALGMWLSAMFKDVAMVPQLAPVFCMIFVMFSGKLRCIQGLSMMAGYMINDESVPNYMAPLK